MHLDLVGQVGRLQTNSDPILQRLLLPIGIEAEHFHFAAAARSQAFQNFHRGRLAGAVWPEQAEDFARLHFDSRSL